MTKLERLNEIFEELKARGIIRNKKDLAEMLGVNYNSFTQAAKGDATRLSENLMNKLEDLYADPDLESKRKSRYGTSAAPAQAPSAPDIPRGSLVIPPGLVQMISDFATTIRSQQETIRGHQETIAAQVKIIERLTKSPARDSQTNVG